MHETSDCFYSIITSSYPEYFVHSYTVDVVFTFLLSQYHGCWCSGSLRRQDTDSHNIDYVEYIGPGLTWGRIL